MTTKNYFVYYRWGKYSGDAVITDQEPIRTLQDLQKVALVIKETILKEKKPDPVPKDELVIMNISAL